MNQRTVIIGTDDRGEVVEALCGECGYKLAEATEYHPSTYCRLVEAGKNPKGLGLFTPRPVDYPKPKKKKEAKDAGTS